MNEREFYERIKDNVQLILDVKGVDKQLVLREVTKSNDRVLMGLTYDDPKQHIAPCFYLNECYDDYMSGKPAADISKELAAQLEKAPLPSFDLNAISDYKSIKDKISVKLVGIEGNENWLKDKVYEKCGDFAAVFYAKLGQNDVGTFSVTMTNEYLSSMKVDRETLVSDAKNHLLAEEYDFRSMAEVMSEMLGMEIPDEMSEGQPPMYVLTSKSRENGAVFITRGDILDRISSEVGGDFYVLPSSIHEVLVIPVSSGMKLSELSQMVKDVNANEVSAEDKLSDHVQYYDSSAKRLENAEKRELRIQKKKERESER